MPPTRSASRAAELEAAIKGMEALATAAQEANSFGPAVQAQAKADTYRAELARVRAEEAANREQDPLKRVQLLRRGAAADASWVAAARLLEQEQELEEAARAQAEAEAKAKRKALTPDELIASLVQRVRAMPPSMQAKIRAQLGWG